MRKDISFFEEVQIRRGFLTLFYWFKKGT